MRKIFFKILKVASVLLIIVTLLCVTPSFVLQAIDSMSSHRTVNDGAREVTTVYETTSPYNYESIDAMCRDLLGSSYNQADDWYFGANNNYRIQYDARNGKGYFYMGKEFIRSFTIAP